MDIKELMTEAKARLTGKKYGSHDIILISRREKHPEVPFSEFEMSYAVEEEVPLRISEANYAEDYDSKKTKRTHPREWDPSDFGCGYGYGHAVNEYYKEVRAERIQWLKNASPVIIGGGVIGGIAGLVLWKVLRKA